MNRAVFYKMFSVNIFHNYLNVKSFNVLIILLEESNTVHESNPNSSCLGIINST